MNSTEFSYLVKRAKQEMLYQDLIKRALWGKIIGGAGRVALGGADDVASVAVRGGFLDDIVRGFTGNVVKGGADDMVSFTGRYADDVVASTVGSADDAARISAKNAVIDAAKGDVKERLRDSAVGKLQDNAKGGQALPAAPEKVEGKLTNMVKQKITPIKRQVADMPITGTATAVTPNGVVKTPVTKAQPTNQVAEIKALKNDTDYLSAKASSDVNLIDILLKDANAGSALLPLLSRGSQYTDEAYLYGPDLVRRMRSGTSVGRRALGTTGEAYAWSNTIDPSEIDLY